MHAIRGPKRRGLNRRLFGPPRSNLSTVFPNCALRRPVRRRRRSNPRRRRGPRNTRRSRSVAAWRLLCLRPRPTRRGLARKSTGSDALPQPPERRGPPLSLDRRTRREWGWASQAETSWTDFLRKRASSSQCATGADGNDQCASTSVGPSRWRLSARPIASSRRDRSNRQGRGQARAGSRETAQGRACDPGRRSNPARHIAKRL